VPAPRASRRALWKASLSARDRRKVVDIGVRITVARKRRWLTRAQAALLCGLDSADGPPAIPSNMS
jgi:hypothetical protein